MISVAERFGVAVVVIVNESHANGARVTRPRPGDRQPCVSDVKCSVVAVSDWVANSATSRVFHGPDPHAVPSARVAPLPPTLPSHDHAGVVERGATGDANSVSWSLSRRARDGFASRCAEREGPRERCEQRRGEVCVLRTDDGKLGETGGTLGTPVIRHVVCTRHHDARTPLS